MGKYFQLSQVGNKRPVFVDGVRTPFVKSFGVFQDCDTLELFSRSLDALTRRLNMDVNEIDEVSCGVVVPQPKNPNVARDSAINMGLPPHVHGVSLNRACTSSLQTIVDAAKSVVFGHPDLVLAGGVECLSDVPIVYSKEARKFLVRLSQARTMGKRLSILKEFSLKAWLPKPPALAEPLTGFTMGEHAEMMAKINGVGRKEQDELALASHKNAYKAQEAGYFKDEIIPIWPSPKFKDCIDKDNMIRGDTSLEALSQLRPAFDRKHGSLTAGNSSPLTDGAAVSLIGDEGRVKSLGLKPKSLIRDFCFVAVEPYPQLLIGPAIAIPLLLKRNNLKISDIDLFEIHEAFAAQVLSCTKAMNSKEFNEKHFGSSQAFGEIPRDRLNVNGGAIAIGHPFGATGSRLVTTLSNELIRRDKSLGVIAICAAGGMAAALLIERLR